MGGSMEFTHILKTVPTRRNHANMEFQGQGEDASILVGFEAAGADEAFRLQYRACDSKSIFPVAILGLDLYPVLFIQIIEIDQLNVKLF
jgi:hypothetical protein